MNSAPPPLRHVCVFAGSYPGVQDGHRQQAVALGAALARRGVGLVFGGSHCGLMGALADAVMAGGGRAVGVMPQGLVDRERAHGGLTELIITPDMHVRKATMAARADAFLALPGGFGTLEELFEVVTWAQLGLHNKPIGLLNSQASGGGFWDGLVAFLDHAGAEGFIPKASLGLLRCDPDPDRLLDLLLQPQA